jgi:hypothetical protein
MIRPYFQTHQKKIKIWKLYEKMKTSRTFSLEKKNKKIRVNKIRVNKIENFKRKIWLAKKIKIRVYKIETD